MPRSLSYADAARLLGGQDSRIVTALEKSAGWLMLGAAPGAAEILGLFDAKVELVRLSHDLVRTLSERRNGLSRYDRTARLEAAHTVLAVSAFFEALGSLGFDALLPTRTEQTTLAGGADLPLHHFGDLMPNPQTPPERFLQLLRDRYSLLQARVRHFVRGLAAWETLPAADRARFEAGLAAVPAEACRRYEESFRRLVADFPEVACWASMREHRATRAALAGMEELLREISSGRLPEERRQSLAVANRAELTRKVAESGEVPDGIRMPSLGEAYVPPLLRASNVLAGDRISEEAWWDGRAVRGDLSDFLIGHLTSPQAVRAPLLVLGQPGSGKSVLSRVLAARLPSADFMPVRVVLRDVSTIDELQLQIEHAILLATGERIEWPALARSAGGALPVVILDGFDELLQAVGVTQTDYLLKVARFQEREAELRRPVAVLVTTRTAVADRARSPEGTVAIRLDPFDDVRVGTWLDIWNDLNAVNFAAQGLRPLPASVVLAHRVLAGQPLLLLMLALYDTTGNALQKAEGNIQAHQLYEDLLRSFALREISKQRPGLSSRDRDVAVENELRRLSVVAFAMFNRAAQWVAEADLARDLAALPFGTPAQRPPTTDMRTPLGTAELTLGRFFFIHQARASQNEERLQTFEFLHATFAEYFVARLTWQLIRDVAARDAASTMSFNSSPADDDLLRALLSFEPLSLRAPVVEFLAALSESTTAEVRDGVRQVALRLFRTVNRTPPTARYADYRPQSPSEPARYASYAANLLLISLATGTVHARELYSELADPVDAWHAQALLWRSQLTTDGWTSLVDSIDVDRIWLDGVRDIKLVLDKKVTPREVDLSRTFKIGQNLLDGYLDLGDLNPLALRRKAYFQCDTLDDIVQHSLEPLSESLGLNINQFAVADGRPMASAAHIILRVMVGPSTENVQAADQFATQMFLPRDDGLGHGGFVRVLLDHLHADRVDARIAVALLQRIYDQNGIHGFLATVVLRRILEFLGRGQPQDDRNLASIGIGVIAKLYNLIDPDVTADLLVRLFEQGLLTALPGRLAGQNSEQDSLVQNVKNTRPDLVPRLRTMFTALASDR
ncbi:NACHT domain-containing protein [Actinoplanes couchii]|uniref:AAA+ ATPase domain-containing protein n=1 Tax=Actinoplanes couchii TaxID=403638 RepID=A0ABQ3XRK3_9ACTN|nr:hypothetical protein [Actinoplanes couchii]MDR6321456.1 hypothetical protein [Actinoplanes couchii]GID61135.1 hypothetical protein Aco03nite_095390 [Actinoplanes couchii]